MYRRMILALAMMVNMMGCGPSLTALQEAESDYEQLSSGETEAQQQLAAAVKLVELERIRGEEAKTRLAMEYAKEASSAAELALNMSRQAQALLNKACNLKPKLNICKEESKVVAEPAPTAEPTAPAEPEPVAPSDPEPDPEPQLLEGHAIKYEAMHKEKMWLINTWPENWHIDIFNGVMMLYINNKMIKSYAPEHMESGKCYWIFENGDRQQFDCPPLVKPPPKEKRQRGGQPDDT